MVVPYIFLTAPHGLACVWHGLLGVDMLPGLELMGCQGMAVPMDVMRHVVHVESSDNPFAIGVVGGRLVRQPKNLPEALATVRMLEDGGYNFSVGLAQVNRYNLAKYGLDRYERAFEACPNLQAGSRILADCYWRSGKDWGKSFSCYYSGNFVTGFRHGYVQKVLASMRDHGSGSTGQMDATASIPLVSHHHGEQPSARSSGAKSDPDATTSRLAAVGQGAQRQSLIASRVISLGPATVARLPSVASLRITEERDAPVLLRPSGEMNANDRVSAGAFGGDTATSPDPAFVF